MRCFKMPLFPRDSYSELTEFFFFFFSGVELHVLQLKCEKLGYDVWFVHLF